MNKILFLYSDISERKILSLCEDALKSVLRKFRKSADIRILQLDFSHSCHKEMKNFLLKNIGESQCALFSGNIKSLLEKAAFRDLFGIYAAQHFSSGKCILTPVTSKVVVKNDTEVTFINKSCFSTFQKTAELATSSAHKGRTEFLLCTDSSSEYDKIFYDEISTVLASRRGFNTEYIDFEEMILYLTKEIPVQDFIICTEEKSSIISAHINSRNKFAIEYTVFHSDFVNIYKGGNRFLHTHTPHSYASILIALASMLEKELGLKNAGAYLRRTTALTFETHNSESIDSFQKQLMHTISIPIKKRKVKVNENNN